MASFQSIVQNFSLLKHIIVVIFFHALLFSPTWIFSQDYGYHIEQIDMEDGLAGGVIYTVYQDRQGYIWIGTINGLFKYDGFQFKRYSQLRNKNSIKGREVKDIVQDDLGNIWLAIWGGNGLQRYDPKEDKFYSYKHDSSNLFSISGDWVN